MDLKNEFRDVSFDENTEKEAKEIEKKVIDENERVIQDLQARLAQVRDQEQYSPDSTEQDDDISSEDVLEEEEEKTAYEKFQPFIWPIMLTLFAIVFAGLFLYFFSQSRQEATPQAIVNVGNVDPTYYPPDPVPVKVVQEPLKCELPQYLNETGDKCLDPESESEPEPEPELASFENGTTTIAHVRFSFDKYSYDNSPKGIYMLEDQIFDGEYVGYKISPTNRAYANDFFFGVDRYAVSLIGSCSYVIDDAKILVKDMNERDKFFTGTVVKVLEASKPRIDCSK